jgi:hypothetical protein
MSETQPERALSQSDRDVLREFADAGNQDALDRLADLAHARGDVHELNDLLDEGCGRAANTWLPAPLPRGTSASCSGWPTKASSGPRKPSDDSFSSAH